MKRKKNISLIWLSTECLLLKCNNFISTKIDWVNFFSAMKLFNSVLSMNEFRFVLEIKSFYCFKSPFRNSERKRFCSSSLFTKLFPHFFFILTKLFSFYFCLKSWSSFCASSNPIQFRNKMTLFIEKVDGEKW